VVGIVSAGREEERLTFAVPASQFEAAVKDLIAAEAEPTR
jgi:hypothetical protein